MIAHLLELCPGLKNAVIQGAAVLSQVRVLVVFARRTQRVPLRSLLGICEQCVCNDVHGFAHDALDIFPGYDLIGVSCFVDLDCPGFCNICGGIPDGSVHIENNAFFVVHMCFPDLLFDGINYTNMHILSIVC